MTLLDIRSGVGAVQHELLRTDVRSEAARQGPDDRIRHVVGDLASVAGAVESADTVTLVRSI
jgi:hypothetical protein